MSLVGLIVNETWPWKKAARGSWREAHANLWRVLKPTFDKELAIIMMYVFIFYALARVVAYRVWGIGWGFR